MTGLNQRAASPLTRGENSFTLLWCFLIIYLFVATAYCVFLSDSLRYWDEEHYLTLAFNLHGGLYSFDGATQTAFQPPGYPLFLSLLSSLISSIPFLRFANFLLFILSVFLAYRLILKYHSSIAAIIFAIMALSNPIFFYTASTFFPQTLETTLLTASIFLIAYSRHQSNIHDFAAGVCYGFLILTVPLLMAYLPFFGTFIYFFHRSSKYKSLAVFLLGCMLAISPWIVRNAIVFDSFIPVSTNGGLNFLYGNSEDTQPNSGVNVDISKYQAPSSVTSEVDRDRHYRQQALTWIHSHPYDAFKLYCLKVLNYFNFSNDLAVKNESSTFREIISFISFYPLLLLAIVRICLWKRYSLSRIEKFILLLLIVSPFIQALFFTRVRFRIPFDFLMLVLAGNGLAVIWEGIKRPLKHNNLHKKG